MCPSLHAPVSLGGLTAPIDQVAVPINNFPDGQSVGLGARFVERLERSVDQRIRAVDHAVFHTDTFQSFDAERFAYTGARRSTW